MEEEKVQRAENAQSAMVDLEETPVEEPAAAKVPLPPAKPKEPRIAPPSSLQEIIGALLFASESPLTATDLRECVRGVEPEEGESSEVMDVYHTCTSREIEQAIHGLEKELERSGCGFRLVCAGGAYRLQTVPTCGRYVRALLHLDRPNRLSRAALETLAIIAYRQPITKAEIEQIRGVAVDTIVKTLVDLQLVRLVGRSELPGHPFLYGTTPLFLEHFGLASLGELNAIDPTLQRSNPRERAKLFQKKEKPADQPDLPDQSQAAEDAKAEVSPASSAPESDDADAASAPQDNADDDEFIDDTPEGLEDDDDELDDDEIDDEDDDDLDDEDDDDDIDEDDDEEEDDDDDE